MKKILLSISCCVAILGSLNGGAGPVRDQAGEAVEPTGTEIAQAIKRLMSDDNSEVAAALARLRGAGPRALPALERLQVLITDSDRFIAQDSLRVLCGIGPEAATAIPAIVTMAVDQLDAWGAEAGAICGSTSEGFGPASIQRWLLEIPQHGVNPGRYSVVFSALVSAGIEGRPELMAAAKRERGVRLFATAEALAEIGKGDAELAQVLIEARHKKRLDDQSFLGVIADLKPAEPSLIAEARALCLSSPKLAKLAEASLRAMEGPAFRRCRDGIR